MKLAFCLEYGVRAALRTQMSRSGVGGSNWFKSVFVRADGLGSRSIGRVSDWRFLAGLPFGEASHCSITGLDILIYR